MSQLPNIPLRVFHNPLATPDAPYSSALQAILNEQDLAQARTEISRWPGYAPTPLLPLPGLAAQLGVATINYKDESQRFSLNSFKALGGAYAVARLLIREIEARTGATGVSTTDLLDGRYRSITGDITVSCATDGNHGRSVAWGAQQFGCRCVIYIHATVSAGRKQAIEHYGAEVVRTPGNYDDSVRIAAQDAERHGRFVVSDTSYEGYTDVPKDVMQGYTVMVDEAISQLGSQLPTHIFIQGGVGGLAAAVCAPFWQRFGAKRPRLIIVEPERADCIFQSIQAGQRIALEGDIDTVMAGLACGEVSLLAWEILRQGADDVITVPDQAALDCMRLLAAGSAGDPPVVAGESAVAGLAGLIGSAADSSLRQELALSADSRILLFGSEGDTDPELYQSIVGRSAAAVRGPA